MMKASKNQLPLIAALLVLGACGEGGPKGIDDGPGAETGANVSSNEPIHSVNGWRKTVLFYVNKDVPEHIIEGAIAAAKSWNLAADKEILSYEGRFNGKQQSSLYSTLDDFQTLIYYDEKWHSHTGKSDGILATTIWENESSNRSYIDRGDVILNAETFLFQDSTAEPIDENRIYDIVDTESVLLHEFGHLLGLDHISEEKDSLSIMHPKTYVGLDIHNRELSDGDQSRIKLIYNHD
jgi:hypothetical protein